MALSSGARSLNFLLLPFRTPTKQAIVHVGVRKLPSAPPHPPYPFLCYPGPQRYDLFLYVGGFQQISCGIHEELS